MNKLITAFVALIAASSVNAATLQWGVDSWAEFYVSADGSSTDSAGSYQGDTSGWKFCLVYLGSSSSWDISSVSDANVVDTFEFGVYKDGDVAYADPYTSSFATTGSATALDGSTLTISAGDYFGVAFYNGSSYSNVYGNNGDSLGDALTTTAQLSSISATANTVSLELTSSGGIAVSAVPEPSVALMGLLGLGMLLKRRKA